MSFGPSQVEAVVGSDLTLNIRLLTELNNEIVSFTDCRHIKFRYTIKDSNLFALDQSNRDGVGKNYKLTQ